MPTLAGLAVHPVKGCAGIPLARCELDRLGLRFDRHWMIVDETGRFRTQRELPALARIRTAIEPSALLLSAPEAPALRVPLDPGARPRREVDVWRHRGPALDEGDAAAAWLSKQLGCACRLVRVPPDHARRVNPERFPGVAHTAFTDGYPLLLISEASIDDLALRSGLRPDARRFRPNLVVSGTEPYAEDRWRRIRIGSVEIAIVKPCDRCVVTTVDPDTGERRGDEPLRTLAAYRRAPGGVLFGQNAVHLAPGTLAVGTTIDVLEEGEPAV